MAYWRTPLVLALGRQRQADLQEFEPSVVYISSSRPAEATSERVSKNKIQLYFYYIHMCVCVWHVHMNAGVCRNQKGMLEP